MLIKSICHRGRDLVDALEHSFAHLGGDLDGIDSVLVQVGDHDTRQFVQFSNASDANDLKRGWGLGCRASR
jgi:hypothetical protein